MRWIVKLMPWITCLSGVIVYLLVLPFATVDRAHKEQLYTLSPKVVRLVSLQFKGAASDFAFLDVLTYLGGNRVNPETRHYLPEQYAWMYNSLKNSVALDPYFMDPYYLMNAALIWDKYNLHEVNSTIASGADIRSWDSLLPFFAGFNYYYFLDDGDKGFVYLKEASKRSNGNPFYDSLAAMVAYKANKTELAIYFLEEQIKQAELFGKANSVQGLKRRLELLRGIRQIELAVEAYKNTFGTAPVSINDLKSTGLLLVIPNEPNGGSFYLDLKGKVKSTKELR